MISVKLVKKMNVKPLKLLSYEAKFIAHGMNSMIYIKAATLWVSGAAAICELDRLHLQAFHFPALHAFCGSFIMQLIAIKIYASFL